MLCGVYILLFLWLPRENCLKVLGLLALGGMLVEIARLRIPAVRTWFLNTFGSLLRVEEREKPTAIVWGVAGAALLMYLPFHRVTVLAALGYLTFGDAAAAVFGRSFGKRPWPWSPKKTLEGSFAFFLACLLWGIWFLPWPVAIGGALLCALVETLPLPGSDNFWIPVFSGVIVQGLLRVLAGTLL